MTVKKSSSSLCRKSNLKKRGTLSIILVFLSVFALSAAFTGCTNTENSNENTTTTTATIETTKQNQTKAIEIIGSTSVQPLAEIIAEKFINENPGTIINYQGIGSSKGITSIKDGICDIGTSSRELKEEEKTWGLKEYIMAIDGIAVAVNPNNSVKELTKEQVVKIFTGEITNWQEVGGNNKNITILSREAGSGTRGAFEELLDLEDKISNKALIFDGNGPMKAAIAGDEAAIGYLSFGFIDNSIKALSIDAVQPTVENVLNSAYPLSRPFIMLVKDDVSDIAKQFLDFVLSDAGQEIVKSEGYIQVKQQ